MTFGWIDKLSSNDKSRFWMLTVHQFKVSLVVCCRIENLCICLSYVTKDNNFVGRHHVYPDKRPSLFSIQKSQKTRLVLIFTTMIYEPQWHSLGISERSLPYRRKLPKLHFVRFGFLLASPPPYSRDVRTRLNSVSCYASEVNVEPHRAPSPATSPSNWLTDEDR